MTVPKETIVQIELQKLLPFKNHPFEIREDEQMQMLVDSVKDYGVLVPALVRPLEDGSYEMIAGHRRKYACEINGITSMPVIVRNVDRDTATIMMVDSNFQRESILPSERAKAYRMKLDAIKRQGARTDLTSVQVGQKLDRKSARDLIAESSPDSSSQIQRYLRLNALEPGLLRMVDQGRIAFTPAVELSFLSKEEQDMLLMTIDSEQATPSLSQAQRMKQLSHQGTLTDDRILAIMTEQKKPESWNLTLPIYKITKYFPKSYTPAKMEETIIKLLDAWMKKRQREQSR